MKFKKVELNAFRAYKNSENGTFDFTLDNGEKIANFISIYAPNGFGKTSFYDGVEWAMTNRIARLDSFTKEADAERKHTEQVNGNREKQNILKNKEVNDSIEAYVKLSTENQEFTRTVEKIIKGGKDYPSKTNSENDFFTSVILSQDGIDDFLKTHDDRARYDVFIDYFGDKGIEKYYKNIGELEKKNEQEKKELATKINDIDKILAEPIDESIFKFTNEKINELNKTGQYLEPIGNDFDEIKKLQFEEKLSEQIVELSGRIEYFQSLVHKLPLWLNDSEKYFNHKAELEKAKLELKDYEELYKTRAEIQFLKENIQKTHTQKVEHERLIHLYPTYKIIIDTIETKENELKKTKLKHDEEEKSLTQIYNDYTELSKQIELAEQNKKQCIDLLASAPKIYENIKEHENKFNANKVSLESQKKLLDGYQAEIKLLNENKKKFELTIESIKTNIFMDIDSDEKYQSDVKNIESWIKDNDSKRESLKSIKIKLEQYKQYNEQIKSLISLGINIIDEKHTDICPLCNTKQESYDILKNKVLNNPLLNTIEKESLEQTEQINYAIKINDKNIEDAKKLIIFDFDNKLQDIKTKLTQLNHEIKKIDLEFLQKEIQEQESSLGILYNKIGNKSEESFKASKMEEIEALEKKLVVFYAKKKQLESSQKLKKDEVELLKVVISNTEKDMSTLKQKEEYKTIFDFTLLFEQKIDVEKVLDYKIESCSMSIKEINEKLDFLNQKNTDLMKQYNIINTNEIKKIIEEIKDKIFKIYTKEIITFESAYEQYFKDKVDNPEKVKKDISDKQIEIEKDLETYKKSIEIIDTLEKSTFGLLKYLESKNKKEELKEYKINLEKKEKVSQIISIEKKQLEVKINKDVESFFHEELINQIYSKIDPHPEFKKVHFKCSFENGIGRLNVFVSDENKHISPSLYYSTAQLNVLSLSIFLAKALNAKDDNGNNVNCIFIDDPIQSMDSINILATIDLFRSLVSNYDKQIILSTHDENFHRLLEKKIPKEYFDSKFIELETFGTVKR